MSFLKILVIGKVIVALVCVILGAILALNHNDQWGWFLVVGVIFGAMSGESKTED